MVEKKVGIESIEGLDIKNSAKFVNVANRFKSSVMLRKGNIEVNAKSILGLISLALIAGDIVTLIIDGTDENECLKAFIANPF